ncbi:MAG TPA: hypothetical protein VM008_11365 [Phycisphaerae bacterium]|nr:hypothetical protein [Phycisphaerae bacterium]
MVTKRAWMSLVVLLCASCSEYGYRYKPEQHSLRPIYADYRVQHDNVDIMVDTNGARLQSIFILKRDTLEAKPKSVDYPKFEDEMMQSGGYMIHGPSMADGPTIAHFDRQEIGAPPWEVHVSIEGIGQLTIMVGK